MKVPDPVHYDDQQPIDPLIYWNGPGWYFWDETWVDRIGPYPTEEDARVMLKKYARWLETGEVS